jgi:hypothetical protein
MIITNCTTQHGGTKIGTMFFFKFTMHCQGKNVNFRCLEIECLGKYSVPEKVELYRQFRTLHNAKLDWI